MSKSSIKRPKNQGEFDDDSRAYDWDFLVYPDSAPETWEDIIDDYKVRWAHSPLHDKDKDPDGTLKKPHWHCILCFDSLKSPKQVEAMLKPINAPKPLQCKSLRGSYRYFWHLDHPHKYPYEEIGYLGSGFDAGKALEPVGSQRLELIAEMQTFIRDTNLTEFCDLLDYAALNRHDDWYYILCNNSSRIMQDYIRSFRNKKKELEVIKRQAYVEAMADMADRLREKGDCND